MTDPLTTLRHDLHGAHARGDAEALVRAISTAPVEAWYAVPPTELRSWLKSLDPAVRNSSPIVHSIATLLSADTAAAYAGGSENPPSDAVASPRAASPDWHHAVAAHFSARLRGQPRAALHAVADLEPPHTRASMLFDTSEGLNALVATQLGISQMLAGRLADALGSFTAAQLVPAPSTLPFLHRDAMVKAALIHALYGDDRTATSLLGRAGAADRTTSWAEDGIDAHAAIASALLASRSAAEEALSQLHAISLPSIGELWPLYIMALYQVYSRAQLHSIVVEPMAALQTASLPRSVGDGYPGSIFELINGALALRRGAPALAASLAAQSDTALIETRLLRAAIDLATGRTAHAIRLTDALRDETAPLRGLELRRIVIAASAHLADRRLDLCAHVLDQATRLPGGLRPGEVAQLSPRLREIGETHVERWPERQDERPPVQSTPVVRVTLTARERDVLTMLAAGLTRAEMAERLVLSPNTVKSHHRSLYRKLGVSRSVDALDEAARLGLIQSS